MITSHAAATQAGDVTEPSPIGVQVVVEAAAAEQEADGAPPASSSPTRRGMRAEVGEGLRYILRHPLLSRIAATTGSSNLFGNIGFAIFVPVAMLVPRPVAPAVLAGALFLASITNVVYNVNQVSLRQAITPDAMLGRMNATMRFLVWGTIPVGSLIGAGLAETVGVETTIWISGILGLLAFLPAFFSPVRNLQRIPSADEAAAA